MSLLATKSGLLQLQSNSPRDELELLDQLRSLLESNQYINRDVLTPVLGRHRIQTICRRSSNAAFPLPLSTCLDRAAKGLAQARHEVDRSLRIPVFNLYACVTNMVFANN